MTDADGLYETDILAWSEEQAALLRAEASRQSGEVAADRRNAGAPDWPHIIEEIQSVGNEQLHAVTSLLVQALVHMLKAEAWPLSREVPHWQAEARGFRGDAADRFTLSMRDKIDMDRVYQRALARLPETIDGTPPLPVPAECPVRLDELLGEM